MYQDENCNNVTFKLLNRTAILCNSNFLSSLCFQLLALQPLFYLFTFGQSIETMATFLLPGRYTPHEPIPKAIRIAPWMCFVISSKVYIFLHILSIISSCSLRVLHKQKGRVVISNHSSFLFVKYSLRQLTLLKKHDILIDRGLFYDTFSQRSIRDASFYFPTNSMTSSHIRRETWICLSSPGFEPVTQMVPVLFGFCSSREICHLNEPLR